MGRDTPSGLLGIAATAPLAAVVADGRALALAVWIGGAGE